VTVQIIGDRSQEADETVVLQLSSPEGASIGTGTGTLTIEDDDS
jgi:hypothetical protein